MEKNEVVAYWLDNAKDDIEPARIMFGAGKYLYTGFMLQQCIEKALKGYYVHVKDEQHPFLHNLVRLAELAGLYSSMSDKQQELLAELTPLYIEARYADDKKKINRVLTEEYCRNLIKETEAMYSWIAQLTT